MGKGSSIKSLAVCESHVMDLRSDMITYLKYITEYERALKDMWSGNGSGASGCSYWNGEKAYEWFESAVNEFNNLCANYNNNYAAFNSFVKTYVKSWNKVKKNKKSKETYTNGVNQSPNTLGGVPQTVNQDASSDTQEDIQGAAKAFTNLNSALTNMITILHGMMDGWNNVKANTTGDLQDKATKRYDYTKNHWSRLKTAQENFVINYSMDTIFSDELSGMDTV